MGLLLLLCAGLLLGRAWLLSHAPASEFEVVEVRGAVPNPGFHPVEAPVTVSAAVAAAGGEVSSAASVAPGSRVVVEEGTVRIEPMDDRLVFGLPLEINTASEVALQTIPGIGPVRAAAIVVDRADNGAYQTMDELARVPGIGPATIERIRPFLTIN